MMDVTCILRCVYTIICIQRNPQIIYISLIFSEALSALKTLKVCL